MLAVRIERIALIYDDTLRRDTTGFYCRRALQQLVQVDHCCPSQMDSILAGRYDLFLSIDDGLRYQLPASLRPTAWWAIDTHMDLDWYLKEAPVFDCVFCAQKDGAMELTRRGIKAIWLPLACDPAIHRKLEDEKTIDISFVGNMVGAERVSLLKLIQSRFADVFIGQCYFEEMARTYSRSRIVFNRSVRNDINMRVFEALACGSFLITNDLAENGQQELFQDGVHFATYRDAEELLDKIHYYLAHEDARERIARVGQSEVVTRHTYKHRMERLLEEVSHCLYPRTSSLISEVKGAGRPSDYSHFPRPELLALVSTSAKRVLDVGCGAGCLGESLKQRQCVEVVGIEVDEQAATKARDRLDRVLTGDMEALKLDFPVASFDCIVCGDILEHLKDPATVLEHLHPLLSENGLLVLSVPNVRHLEILANLGDGNWTYEQAGILDRGHLRFFTRREMEKLLFRAGFEIVTLREVRDPEYEGWEKAGKPRNIRMGRVTVEALSSAEAEELFVYQYLVAAKPIRRRDYGLTSIVVLTHNQLGYTKCCLDSIAENTLEPYELIVVDNSSDDGTVDYLRSRLDLRVILNRENRGFAAGVNQGINVAQGNQILLLNNDTIVTFGWLSKMLRCLYSQAEIAAVGPLTNCTAGNQRIDVPYRTLTQIQAFAWDLGRSQSGCSCFVTFLGGFCLLVRRSSLERVGVFDERFGLGTFEDTDFCARLCQAGYRLAIALDSFVHHYGSRTLNAVVEDPLALLEENRQIFERKWGLVPSVEVDSPPQVESVREGHTLTFPWKMPRAKLGSKGGLLLTDKPVLLSLCMIVRDAGKTLPAALESIRPCVDEMVVVDTGSRDNTAAVAVDLGARILHFPWCDSFSEARNESLRHARGRWIFWMDADDTIDAANGQRLRDLAEHADEGDTLGYVLQVHCPASNEEGELDATIVDHVKLFRNRPDVRFDGRVHEQILPSIRRAGGKVKWTDVFVIHSGYDHGPEAQRRKRERDLRLLSLELNERPNHPFTLFNLGMTYFDMREYEKAVGFLAESIKHSDPRDSHVRKAYALLVGSYRFRGQHAQAWQICQEGRRVYAKDPELLFLQGILQHHFGRLGEAAASYEAVLSERDDDHFSSLDKGIVGYKARHNLAVVHIDAGELTAAETQWRQVLNEVPTYKPAWRGLGECLLRQGKTVETKQMASELLRHPLLRSEAMALRAKIALTQNDVGSARSHLEAAVASDPTNPEALRDLCQLLFEHASAEDTEAALRKLAAICPDDGAVHHNLATVYLRQGRALEATAAYQRSLRCRPGSAVTFLYLGRALKALSRTEEAIGAFRESLRLSPDSQEAHAELEMLGGCMHEP